jgi:hypothetical protein
MVWDANLVEDIKESMDNVMDNINIDDIKSEGMTVRIGGRVVKLEITEETILPEDEIRAEYSRKLTEKLQTIKSVLNEKMSEMAYMVEQNKQDYEEKERELQQRLTDSNLMPDITYEQAKNGLSVVKGSVNRDDEPDTLTWLYQGVYWPKFVDGTPIEPKYAKRLISPVTIEIITVSNRITSVVVRKTIGLEKFEHYHSMGHNSDCWGEWKHRSHWTSSNDILDVARESIAVLDNVNSHSPGNQSPNGLPRLATLQQHLLNGEAARNVEYTVSRADERSGITTRPEVASGGVWST